MQELEKILEEIDIKIAGSMGRKREGLLEARDIIRKHMNNCRWADDVTQANNRRHPDKVKNQYGIWDYKNPPEPYHPERSEGKCARRIE